VAPKNSKLDFGEVGGLGDGGIGGRIANMQK
jgi:hypothetical protein